jgi:hypothetical protein
MKRITIERDIGVPHRLFDLSIESLEERKKKSVVYPSGMAVANYLGVGPKRVFDNRAVGKRIWSDKLKKEFAVRLEK